MEVLLLWERRPAKFVKTQLSKTKQKLVQFVTKLLHETPLLERHQPMSDKPELVKKRASTFI